MKMHGHLHAGGRAPGAPRLILRRNLTEFPREVFALADSLEILDLSGNALSALPDDLPRLSQLRVLFCSGNHFTALPEVLGHCPALTMVGFKANRIRTVPGSSLGRNLRWLILTDNQIESLPASVGQCTQLQKLMLAGNHLTTLPPELAACRRLELLRISANRLTEFPIQLLDLPNLSWLAFAGNPFCEDAERFGAVAGQHATGMAVRWRDLALEHTLGEGASGVIHQASLQTGATPQPVAVKVFRGEVTSDGLPQSEITACMRAGMHPNLIPVIGAVPDHPAGLGAMVMALMDPGYRSLAGPPSLDSCTRDVYAEGTRFGLARAIRIALGIVSAARHLHARGITHGDLYAHNILVNQDGHGLLGDFGAASSFPIDDLPLAQGLQAIEVRAVGCLLQELLERCEASQNPHFALARLADLSAACLQEDPRQRPSLAELELALTTLS